MKIMVGADSVYIYIRLYYDCWLYECLAVYLSVAGSVRMGCMNVCRMPVCILLLEKVFTITRVRVKSNLI